MDRYHRRHSRPPSSVLSANLAENGDISSLVTHEAGVIPRILAVRLENFSMVFLWPLFFACTQVNLLNDATSWLVVGGIILVERTRHHGASADGHASQA